MHQLIADTLDDLLLKVFPKILRNGQRVKASKGWNRELSGVVLELTTTSCQSSGRSNVMLFEFFFGLAKGNSSNESMDRKSESRRLSASATFAPNACFATSSLSQISRRACVAKANSNAIHCPVADSGNPSRLKVQLKVACCILSSSAAIGCKIQGVSITDFSCQQAVFRFL